MTKKKKLKYLIATLLVISMFVTNLNIVFAYSLQDINDAKKLEILGKYEEALQIYDAIIQANGGTAELYINKGSVLFYLKRYEEAKLAFDKSNELDTTGKYIFNYNNIGVCLGNLGRYEEALMYFDIAIEKGLNSWLLYCNKGTILAKLNRFEEAITNFDKAIKLDPNYILSYTEKAWALINLGKYNEAVDICDEVSPGAIIDFHQGFYKGLALYKKGDYLSALDCFEAINRFKEGQIDVMRYAALYISKLDGFSETAKLLSDKTLKYPESDSLCIAMGVVYNNLRKYNEAVKFFDKAIELNAFNANAYYNKGLAKENAWDTSAALDNYNKALELNPYYKEAYLKKGFVLMLTGKHEEAITCFDKAIENGMITSNAYTFKGDALRFLGRYQDAILAYDTALAIEVEDTSAMLSKAFALNKLEKYNEAIAIIDKAIKIDPKNHNLYMVKARAYESMKMYKEALAAVDQAIKAAPMMYSSYFYKGNLHMSINNFEEAIQAYDIALLDKYNLENVTDQRNKAVEALAKKNNGLMLNKTLLEIKINSAEALKVTSLAGYSSKADLTWYTSNPKAATVDKKGLVIGTGLGEAIIYAESKDKKIKLFCKVTVSK